MYKKKETAILHLTMGEKFESKKFDLFRDDEEVVFCSMTRDYVNFKHCPMKFRRSKKFILRVLKYRIDMGCYYFNSTHTTKLKEHIPKKILKLAPRGTVYTQQFIDVLEKTIAMEELQETLKTKTDTVPVRKHKL